MTEDEVQSILSGLAPRPMTLVESAMADAAQLLAPAGEGLFAKYRYDALGYFRDVLKTKYLSESQKYILELVSKPSSDEWHRKLAVGTGVNFGKSYTGGGLINWYYDAWGPCIVATTAPSQQSVVDLLWKEVRLQRSRADQKWGIGPNDFKGPQAPEMRRAPDWWARGYVAAKGENFKGRHVENMMFMFDESVGLVEMYFRMTKTMFKPQTSMLWICFYNPTDTASAMYQELCRPDSDWTVIELSSLEHPNVLAGLRGEEIPIPAAVSLEQLQEGIKDDCEPVDSEDKEATDFEWPPGSGQWWRPGPSFEGEYLGRWPSSDDSSIWSDALWKAVTKKLQWSDVVIPVDEIPRIGCDVAYMGCFDNKTEILTNRGWMLFENLIGEEKVLSLGQNDIAEWQPITQIHRYDFDGDLNVCENDGISFAITDNHRLVAKSKNYKSFSLIEFRDLTSDFIVKRVNSWSGIPIKEVEFVSEKKMPHGGEHTRKWIFDPLDWCSFIGWFVSEGCVIKEKRNAGRLVIRIAQRDPDKLERISDLLKKMGIKATLNSGSMTFSNNVIGKHLLDHCGKFAVNKKIPSYIKEATQEQIEAFLDSYCDGDGCRSKDGSRRCYFTSSLQLANDLQEVLVKIGKCGKCSVRSLAGSSAIIDGRVLTRRSDMYSIGERKRPMDAWITSKNLTKMPYKGIVYCVSTPLETIMVRRNGRVMWSGNSAKTATSVVWGDYAVHIESKGGQQPMRTVGRCVELADEWAERCNKQRQKHGLSPIAGKNIPIKVDDTGIGGGVVSRLRELRYNVWAIGAAEKAMRQNRYPNKRSELWFLTKDRGRIGKLFLGLLPSRMLVALRKQAVAPKWMLNSAGQREVERKEVTESRLGTSIDLMDCLNLGVYTIDLKTPEIIHVDNQQGFMDRRQEAKDNREGPLWMGRGRSNGRPGLFRRR